MPRSWRLVAMILKRWPMPFAKQRAPQRQWERRRQQALSRQFGGGTFASCATVDRQHPDLAILIS